MENINTTGIEENRHTTRVARYLVGFTLYAEYPYAAAQPESGRIRIMDPLLDAKNQLAAH